jgi:hypothetical protein
VRTSESKDHWQLYDSSAVLNLKFLTELAVSNDRNFKFTALGGRARALPCRVFLIPKREAGRSTWLDRIGTIV